MAKLSARAFWHLGRRNLYIPLNIVPIALEKQYRLITIVYLLILWYIPVPSFFLLGKLKLSDMYWYFKFSHSFFFCKFFYFYGSIMQYISRFRGTCGKQFLLTWGTTCLFYRYFSYEHFYVIYCKFWELDTDHDFFIDKENLIRYGNHALTYRIVDRIFSQVCVHHMLPCFPE